MVSERMSHCHTSSAQVHKTDEGQYHGNQREDDI